MKQFNLEEYLASPSKKVVTRDGRNARIICHDAKGICPVVVLVDYENNEVSFNATKDGRIDGVLDLFFAPEKKEGWINIYKNSWSGEIYHSKEDAFNNRIKHTYITTIKIEWEE